MVYRRMFISIIMLMIISSVLKALLYPCHPLWASFFSSISSGCVIGLIFLVYQNMKENEAKKLEKQLEKHSEMCPKLYEVNSHFQKHQSALINAEGNEHSYHLAKAVKYAKEFVETFSLLAKTCPNYYSVIIYDSLSFKESFSEVMDKISWLESKLNEPPPEIDDRMEYLLVAHNVHCAFFEVIVRTLDSATDIDKKRKVIDKSIV